MKRRKEKPTLFGYKEGPVQVGRKLRLGSQKVNAKSEFAYKVKDWEK